jgi:hypothetical protein
VSLIFTTHRGDALNTCFDFLPSSVPSKIIIHPSGAETYAARHVLFIGNVSILPVFPTLFSVPFQVIVRIKIFKITGVTLSGHIQKGLATTSLFLFVKLRNAKLTPWS